MTLLAEEVARDVFHEAWTRAYREAPGSADSHHDRVALRAVCQAQVHGFGFKITGLQSVGNLLTSSDSLAWSYHARREPPLPECVGRHKNCANCPIFALEWREALLSVVGATADQQLTLWAGAA